MKRKFLKEFFRVANRKFWFGFLVLAVVSLVVSSAVSSAVQAETQVLYGTTDKDPISYQKGEEITFFLQFLEEGIPVAGRTLRWLRRGDDGVTQTGEVVSATEPVCVRTSLDRPGFVLLRVEALDEQRNLLPMQAFYGGAGVCVDQITESVPEPKDFDAFWDAQKARLAQVPLRATQTPVESGNPEVLAYDVQVDCVGMPVSGFYCKPKNARAKSHPALMAFEGYSVRGAVIPSEYYDFSGPATSTFGGFPATRPVDTAAKQYITLEINPHGLPNGQPPEFYQKQAATTLREYGLRPEENAKPETCYFLGMYLRVLRALEFLKSQSEWDGKTLIVTGGSQGGMQCLAAAGLDPQVTHCYPHIPWCVDLASKDRFPSRFYPVWTPALGYFDAANHAKRITAQTWIDAGLGDDVCPPTGQMVLYNQLTCPKKIQFIQGREHSYWFMPSRAGDFSVSTLQSLKGDKN